MCKKRKYRFIFFLLTSYVLLFCFLTSVYAEDSNSNSNSSNIGFSVKANIPETQLNKNKTYFTPWLRPGEEQTISVQVTSKQKDPITVQAIVKNAMTNAVGNIQYVDASVPLDETLITPVTDIVKAEQSEITLSNFETKIMTFKITPPKEEFIGIKLGALNFVEKETEDEKQKGVINHYGYNIGIVLNEDKTNIYGAKKLNFVEVKPALFGGRRGVAAVLQNPTPYVMEGLKVETKLTTRDRKTVLRTENQDKLKMAPNSSFDFMTYWGIEDMNPGKYSLHVLAKANGETWDWWKDFEITDKQAKKINNEAGYHLSIPKNFFIYLYVLIALTSINLLAEIIILRKKG